MPNTNRKIDLSHLTASRETRAGRVLTVLKREAHATDEMIGDAIGVARQTILAKRKGLMSWSIHDCGLFAEMFGVPDYLFLLDPDEPGGFWDWWETHGRPRLGIVSLTQLPLPEWEEHDHPQSRDRAS